jgi:hypothetical protein
MKFGKNLKRAQRLSVGVWADKWIDYRLLKRLSYSARPQGDAPAAGADAASDDEVDCPASVAPTTVPEAAADAGATAGASAGATAGASAGAAEGAGAGSGAGAADGGSSGADSAGGDDAARAQQLLRELADSPHELAFFRQLQRELRKVSLHFATQEGLLVPAFRQTMRHFEAFCARYLAPTDAALAPGPVDAAAAAVDANSAAKGASSSSAAFVHASAHSGAPRPRSLGSDADRALEATRILGSLVRLSSMLIQLENYVSRGSLSFLCGDDVCHGILRNRSRPSHFTDPPAICTFRRTSTMRVSARRSRSTTSSRVARRKCAS